jgi:hypothetical protein
MLTGVGISVSLSLKRNINFLVRPHLVDLRAQVRGKAAAADRHHYY